MKIDERIKGIKVWVPNEVVRRNLEEKIFELNEEKSREKKEYIPEPPFLYVDEMGKISWGYSKREFNCHKNKEVYWEDLLEWEPREQLDYSKWIGRDDKTLAIKGDSHLISYIGGSLIYNPHTEPQDFVDKAPYEVVTADELKNGDVCIPDNVKYEDTILEDFLVFMGKDEKNYYVFDFLENIDGVERLTEAHYYQDDQKFKRFLRE